MLVMPADHIIEPVQEFRRAVHVAEQMAEEHPATLITFGIPPTYPATGYGYIHRGQEIACPSPQPLSPKGRREQTIPLSPAAGERGWGEGQDVKVFRVQAFREKPSQELAEQFVSTGEFFWNSGIFVWKAATILHALRERQPGLCAAVERIADAWPTSERAAVLRREYKALERISIDYAVMEHAARPTCCPVAVSLGRRR